MEKTKLFESNGIFISIVFARNLNRLPAWRYQIDNVEDMLFESGRFYDYDECVNESLKKAVELLP